MTVTLEAPATVTWDSATHVVEFEVHFATGARAGTWETTVLPFDPETPDDLQDIRRQITVLIAQGWSEFYEDEGPWEIKRMHVFTSERYGEFAVAGQLPPSACRW